MECGGQCTNIHLKWERSDIQPLFNHRQFTSVDMAEKHDVFVGNVTFNTTEEQLQEIFSFVGPIKNIRILTDQNTGRPKGFAFIEYSDANTALAAIRHLDGHELNNRKLRVSYSNNSNLKEIARSIGQVIPDIYQTHISTKQEYQAGESESYLLHTLIQA